MFGDAKEILEMLVLSTYVFEVSILNEGTVPPGMLNRIL